MTYAQIEQIENFISQLNLLEQKNPDDGYNYAHEIDNLNDQIIVSVKGYDSSRIDYDKAYVENYHTHSGYYDTDKLKNIIKIMRSSLQAVLNAEPLYPKICELRSDIKESENVAEGDELYYIAGIVEKYSNTIKFSESAKKLAGCFIDGNGVDDFIARSIFEAVVNNLKLYLKSIDGENAQVKLPDNKVTVVQNNNQSNYQNVAVSIDLSIENCLKDLDDCETLSGQELESIKNQLEEKTQLLEDNHCK